MGRTPRQIGTEIESAVVRYLRGHGFPGAERRALRGVQDAGDVTGCPGLVFEIKGGKAAAQASDGQVADWLLETESGRVYASADIGLLVIRRSGIGAANAGRWWAVVTASTAAVLLAAGEYPPAEHQFDPVRLHLSTAVVLLRQAGYGQPLDTVEAIA